MTDDEPTKETSRDENDSAQIENQEEMDIVPDEESENPAESLRKLRQKLRDSTKEKQQYLDGWQRAKADFINFRAQQEKARSDFSKFAKGEIIAQIIPVLDSFEMALAGETPSGSVPETWKKGMENIYAQLKKVLAENGAVGMNPLGQKFDPAMHSAIESVQTDSEEEDGKVLKVIQQGYMLSDRVIRPALVAVGTYKK